MYLTASQMDPITLECMRKKVGDLSNFRKQYLTAHYKKNSKNKAKILSTNTVLQGYPSALNVQSLA